MFIYKLFNFNEYSRPIPERLKMKVKGFVNMNKQVNRQKRIVEQNFKI